MFRFLIIVNDFACQILLRFKNREKYARKSIAQPWENGKSLYNFDLKTVRINRLMSVEHNHYSYCWYRYMVRMLSTIIKLSTLYCEVRSKMRDKYVQCGTTQVYKQKILQ
jgi:hypothetical protein